MSVLPKGWASAALSELQPADGLFSDGDWVESKDQDPDGCIRLLQLADIGDGVFIDKSNRFINESKFAELRCTELFENDVLIARMPDPLGRACLMPKLPQRCITVVDVAIFRSGSTSVVPRWLMHTINAPQFRAEIELNSSGTTRKRISRGNLSAMQLPTPPSEEQKRIADKLDRTLARVDACRDRLDRLPTLLKRCRQAILAAATSGRLTEDWRAKNAVSEAVAPVLLGDLIAEGPQNGLYKPSTAYGSGVGILRIDMFYDGEVTGWAAMKRLEVSTSELAAYGLAVGDIVVNRVNSPPYVGKAALIRDLSEPCVFESNMMRIRLDRSRVLPEYCIRFLSSMEGLTQLRRNVKHAVNQASINQADVKSVNILLPRIPEQHEIVRRVETLFAFIDRLEARVAGARKQVGQLTPALLAKAFRGELVPQDPDDEPASELLERLAAARSAAPKARRGRKAEA